MTATTPNFRKAYRQYLKDARRDKVPECIRFTYEEFLETALQDVLETGESVLLAGQVKAQGN